MPSNHSEITGYINEGDIARISAALIGLAASEGRRLDASPTHSRVRYVLEPSNNWNLALLPGAPGWTVVHAQPWNVLCYPSPATGSRRFVDLCAALGVRGFVIDVVDVFYQGDMLLETDGHGSCRLSGFYYTPGSEFSYHGTPLDVDKLEGIRFEVCADLACARSFASKPGILDMDKCREIACEVGGDNGKQFWSNGEDFSGAWIEIQEAMINGGPLPADGGALLQFVAESTHADPGSSPVAEPACSLPCVDDPSK